VNVTVVDATGVTTTTPYPITLSAARTDVTVKIYDATGELIALLPTPNLTASVASITVGPSPFEPNVAGTNAATIHLFDSHGVEIDADPVTPGVQGVLWYGRECQNASMQCSAPADGLIVRNGVYVVQVISTDPAGERTISTADVTVSHATLDLVTNVQAVPNPVSGALLSAPGSQARIWVAYNVGTSALAGLHVKIYNVAGEVVRTFEAADQALSQAGADPLGTKSGSCTTAACPGTFAWDGKNQLNTVCAPGLYVIVVDAFDAAGNIQRTIVKIAIQ